MESDWSRKSPRHARVGGKGSKTAGGMNVWESLGTGKRETGGGRGAKEEEDEDRIGKDREKEERRGEERRGEQVKLRRRVEMKRARERMREVP